ncbi:C2H2-type zinc finger transcription factor [Mucor lusitanicus]
MAKSKWTTLKYACEHPHCIMRYPTLKALRRHYNSKSFTHAYPRPVNDKSNRKEDTGDEMAKDEGYLDRKDQENETGSNVPLKLLKQTVKICQDGCRPLTGAGSQCIDGNKKYDGGETGENQKQDQREIRMLSLGETMARMVANEETLDLLQYPSKFQHKQKVYKDFFSGSVYQDLSKSDLCKNADLNIFYGLYIDSYVNTSVSKNTHFTVIHCLVFNFEPSLR